MRSKLEWKFWRFHRANPHVYNLLVQMARQWAQRRPESRLGVKALYERARWEHAFVTGDTEFKLNNVFTAFYARLIMHREQDLEDLFELRVQREPFTYEEPTESEVQIYFSNPETEQEQAA